MILNATSGAGAPILYQYGDYRRVIAEGEAAKRALATNIANQNQVSNVIVDTNKSLNIKQQEGQNSQQGQRSQDNAIQNNKNSINKAQAQGNQNSPNNQQVGKGLTSNSQQSKPIPTNKIKNNNYVNSEYLTKPEQGGTLVIAAGNNPIKGTHNIDIKENIKIGVFKGDATNLVNVPTGSQAKVIIENPYGFDPTNSEILRVLQKGGELRITGTETNRFFKNMLRDDYKPPKGFKLIKQGDISESERRQGFKKDGEPIGKPTDKEVILIKE